MTKRHGLVALPLGCLERIMRPLSFFLICFSLIAPATPAMAEYLQGTVVRIDRDRGEVEIMLSENGQCHLDSADASIAKEGRVPTEKARSVLVKAAWFPRCLGKGAQVYARGQFAPDRSDLFEAEDVFPCRRRGGHDPTGVRSRFQHHRRQMMRPRGEAMHD